MLQDELTLLRAAIFFILGAVVGSFLNVCIYRLPRSLSVVTPPSRCPSCERRLRLWPDMVPLLSQLVYRSRCRHCGARFSWRYLWVEAITGFLFAAVAVRWAEHPWHLAANLVFVGALVAIAFIDLEEYLIPDQLVWVALGAGIVRDVALIGLGQEERLWRALPGVAGALPIPASIWGAALSFWFLWQLAALASAAVKQEAMGAGDATLLAAIGANLWPHYLIVIAFMTAVVLGAVAGLIRMALEEWRPARRPTPAGESGYPPAALVTAGGPGETAVVSHAAPDAAPEEPEPPVLPRDSRLGRVLFVAGTWALAGGVWWLAACWSHGEPGRAMAGGLLALTLAAALLRYGGRLWRRGDAVWAPAADEHFEATHGGPRVIPFGPCLVIGSLVALFFGDVMVQAYLEWLGLAGTGF